MKNYIVKYSPANKYLIVELGKSKETIEDYLTDDISKAARFGLLSVLEKTAEFMKNREIRHLNTQCDVLLKKIFSDCEFIEVEDPEPPGFQERLREYEEASRIGQ